MSIRLFSTPLDGSLVGNPAATATFAARWAGLSSRTRPLLCYNTGRLGDDVLALINAGTVPRPDFIIAAVGTEILDVANGGRIDGYARRSAEGGGGGPWGHTSTRQLSDPVEIELVPAISG